MSTYQQSSRITKTTRVLMVWVVTGAVLIGPLAPAESPAFWDAARQHHLDGGQAGTGLRTDHQVIALAKGLIIDDPPSQPGYAQSRAGLEGLLSLAGRQHRRSYVPKTRPGSGRPNLARPRAIDDADKPSGFGDDENDEDRDDTYGREEEVMRRRGDKVDSEGRAGGEVGDWWPFYSARYLPDPDTVALIAERSALAAAKDKAGPRRVIDNVEEAGKGETSKKMLGPSSSAAATGGAGVGIRGSVTTSHLACPPGYRLVGDKRISPSGGRAGRRERICVHLGNFGFAAMDSGEGGGDSLPLEWDEAQQKCRDKSGGTLLSVRDDSDAAHLSAIMVMADCDGAQGGGNMSSYGGASFLMGRKRSCGLWLSGRRSERMYAAAAERRRRKRRSANVPEGVGFLAPAPTKRGKWIWDRRINDPNKNPFYQLVGPGGGNRKSHYDVTKSRDLLIVATSKNFNEHVNDIPWGRGEGHNYDALGAGGSARWSASREGEAGKTETAKPGGGGKCLYSENKEGQAKFSYKSCKTKNNYVCEVRYTHGEDGDEEPRGTASDHQNGDYDYDEGEEGDDGYHPHWASHNHNHDGGERGGDHWGAKYSPRQGLNVIPQGVGSGGRVNGGKNIYQPPPTTDDGQNNVYSPPHQVKHKVYYTPAIVRPTNPAPRDPASGIGYIATRPQTYPSDVVGAQPSSRPPNPVYTLRPRLVYASRPAAVRDGGDTMTRAKFVPDLDIGGLEEGDGRETIIQSQMSHTRGARSSVGSLVPRYEKVWLGQRRQRPQKDQFPSQPVVPNVYGEGYGRKNYAAQHDTIANPQPLSSLSPWRAKSPNNSPASSNPFNPLQARQMSKRPVGDGPQKIAFAPQENGGWLQPNAGRQSSNGGFKLTPYKPQGATSPHQVRAHQINDPGNRAVSPIAQKRLSTGVRPRQFSYGPAVERGYGKVNLENSFGHNNGLDGGEGILSGPPSMLLLTSKGYGIEYAGSAHSGTAHFKEPTTPVPVIIQGEDRPESPHDRREGRGRHLNYRSESEVDGPRSTALEQMMMTARLGKKHKETVARKRQRYNVMIDDRLIDRNYVITAPHFLNEKRRTKRWAPAQGYFKNYGNKFDRRGQIGALKDERYINANIGFASEEEEEQEVGEQAYGERPLLAEGGHARNWVGRKFYSAAPAIERGDNWGPKREVERRPSRRSGAEVREVPIQQNWGDGGGGGDDTSAYPAGFEVNYEPCETYASTLQYIQSNYYVQPTGAPEDEGETREVVDRPAVFRKNGRAAGRERGQTRDYTPVTDREIPLELGPNGLLPYNDTVIYYTFPPRSGRRSKRSARKSSVSKSRRLNRKLSSRKKNRAGHDSHYGHHGYGGWLYEPSYDGMDFADDNGGWKYYSGNWDIGASAGGGDDGGQAQSDNEEEQDYDGGHDDDGNDQESEEEEGEGDGENYPAYDVGGGEGGEGPSEGYENSETQQEPEGGEERERENEPSEERGDDEEREESEPSEESNNEDEEDRGEERSDNDDDNREEPEHGADRERGNESSDEREEEQSNEEPEEEQEQEQSNEEPPEQERESNREDEEREQSRPEQDNDNDEGNKPSEDENNDENGERERENEEREDTSSKNTPNPDGRRNEEEETKRNNNNRVGVVARQFYNPPRARERIRLRESRPELQREEPPRWQSNVRIGGLKRNLEETRTLPLPKFTTKDMVKPQFNRKITKIYAKQGLGHGRPTKINREGTNVKPWNVQDIAAPSHKYSDHYRDQSPSDGSSASQSNKNFMRYHNKAVPASQKLIRGEGSFKRSVKGTYQKIEDRPIRLKEDKGRPTIIRGPMTKDVKPFLVIKLKSGYQTYSKGNKRIKRQSNQHVYLKYPAYHGHPSNPHKYIVCSTEGYGTVMDCSPGTKWDAGARICH